MNKDIIPEEVIEKKIYLVRGKKVLLDSDLAELYGVSIKRLNEQVKRNAKRFPSDFMFALTIGEARCLRSQFATLNRTATTHERRGKHRKYLPHAFTEQGVAMLSGVLHSGRAIEVNISIMRAFVKLREILSAHKELADKLADLEAKYDAQFKIVFDAIRELMTPPEKPKRKIGF